MLSGQILSWRGLTGVGIFPGEAGTPPGGLGVGSESSWLYEMLVDPPLAPSQEGMCCFGNENTYPSQAWRRVGKDTSNFTIKFSLNFRQPSLLSYFPAAFPGRFYSEAGKATLDAID